MFENILRPQPPLDNRKELAEYRRCQAESWIAHLCDSENRLPARGEVEAVMRRLENGDFGWGPGLYDDTRTVAFRANPTAKARAERKEQARISFLLADWRDFLYLCQQQQQFRRRHRALFLPWKELLSTIYIPWRGDFRWKGQLRPCCFDSLRDYPKSLLKDNLIFCHLCLTELRRDGECWRQQAEVSPQALQAPPFTEPELRILSEAFSSLQRKARSRIVDKICRGDPDWSQLRSLLATEVRYSGHRFDLFGHYLGRIPSPPLTLSADQAQIKKEPSHEAH